jgi:myo-inositol-1(or 4)-monophosphatase
MIDLKKLCNEIVKAASETGAYILKESEEFDLKKTETKGLNDFVSYVDKGAEKMLVESLSLLLPEAGFIAEEGTSVKQGKKYCWIIDPLDGTTNFLHGLHPYAISIALREYDRIIAGVVYEVSGDEIFIAWKNGGAWLNGLPIHVSNTTRLADSMVATGFPYNNFDRLESYMNCLTHLVQKSQGIRRLGSAAIDLAYVACGRFDAFYEYDLHIWDIAAGLILVREAGGQVGDFSGSEDNITGEEIVAANCSVYSELQEIVCKFMNN